MFVDVVLNVQKQKMNLVETIGTGMDDAPPDSIAKVMAQMEFTTQEENFVPK